MSKYQVDENFFDEINTEEKSYWLGFLYADGYVIKRKNKYYSGMLIKDKEHMEKYKNDINSNSLILERKDGSFYINIYNKIFTKKLMKQGVVPRKTKIIKFPKLKEDLINHFIRGYFDGDGSITCTEKTLNFHICCASYEFLEQLLIELKNNIDFDRKLKIYERKDGLYNIITSSINDINKLYNYLYKDCVVYLERKKEKFDYINQNEETITKNIQKYWRECWKKRKKNI